MNINADHLNSFVRRVSIFVCWSERFTASPEQTQRQIQCFRRVSPFFFYCYYMFFFGGFHSSKTTSFPVRDNKRTRAESQAVFLVLGVLFNLIWFKPYTNKHTLINVFLCPDDCGNMTVMMNVQLMQFVLLTYVCLFVWDERMFCIFNLFSY